MTGWSIVLVGETRLRDKLRVSDINWVVVRDCDTVAVIHVVFVRVGRGVRVDVAVLDDERLALASRIDAVPDAVREAVAVNVNRVAVI